MLLLSPFCCLLQMGLQYFPAPKNSFEFVLLMTAESAAAGTKVAVCLENTNTYQPMLAGQGLLMRNGQRIRVNQFEIEVVATSNS